MTAYIWDLDGTLLDSYEMIVAACSGAASDAGLDDPEEYILRSVKQGSVGTYLKDAGARCGRTAEELLALYRLHMDGMEDRIPLMDGAAETLEKLRRAGAVHFVYTHKGSASERILRRLGILDCFREVVTAEYGLRPKPSGDGVKYLTEKYGLDPAQTWYVGDRTLDVFCAKDAGVKALLFLPPGTCVEPTGKEDRIVADLREI